MRKKLLLPVLTAGSLLFAAFPSYAIGASDGTGDTIEPIAVKADVQVPIAAFRTTNINEGNITSFDLTAIGGVIKGRVTVAANLPQTPLQAAQIAPPYGGVHVMVHFQTTNMQELSYTGCTSPPSVVGPCAPADPVNPSTPWVPMFKSDRESLALFYGVVANETDNDSSVARYDPSGRLVAVPVGQVWGVQGQRTSSCDPNGATNPPAPYDGADMGPLPAGRGNSTSISFPAANTIEISTPYLYQYRTAPPATASGGCLARQKRLVDAGERLENAVAFSWADHCICAPDPVGLILGWTWYLDSVPAVKGGPGSTSTLWGYKVGTPSGDVNPAAFLGPNCPVFVRGQQVNPLYTGTACMIPNPIGPGFNLTGINTPPAT